MPNIDEGHALHCNAAPRLINKPILTPDEAARLLGISKCTLKAYNAPRHYLNTRNHWYLMHELVQWVQALPMRGEMPTHDEYTHEIRIV